MRLVKAKTKRLLLIVVKKAIYRVANSRPALIIELTERERRLVWPSAGVTVKEMGMEGGAFGKVVAIRVAVRVTGHLAWPEHAERIGELALNPGQRRERVERVRRDDHARRNVHSRVEKEAINGLFADGGRHW